MRHQDTHQRLAPRNVSKGECPYIGEQAQRQPFQHRHIALVVEENLRGDRDHAERNDIKHAVPADQKLGGVRHRAEIRRDIDGVGDEQQRDHHVQQQRRIMPANVAGDAVPGDAADPRRNFLDRRHQRKRQQHGPADAIAELRAGLAVGADAGGIVIGRASDQARADSKSRESETAPGADRSRAALADRPFFGSWDSCVCDVPCLDPAAATTAPIEIGSWTGTCPGRQAKPSRRRINGVRPVASPR